MILSALALSLPGVELSMPPLTWEHWVLIGALCLAAFSLAWLMRGIKIRSMRKAEAFTAAKHATELAAQMALGQTQDVEVQRKLDDALADRAVLEQRFTLHRESTQRHEKEAQDLVAALDAELAAMHELATQFEPAKTRLAELELAQAVLQERLTAQHDAEQRREAEAQARIAALENDLTAARELSAQLPPTKARIGDLEAVVASERGRKEALEQMVTITTQRAEDLESQLRAAQQQLADYETQARQRQSALAQDLAERQQANAADTERFQKAESELAKLQETYDAYRQQAETKITHLQSADQPNEKRVRVLEDRVAEIEAEGRKKALEDSFKIAELEYRLLAAHDALASAKGPEGQEPPQLLPPPTQNP
jgi:chromosome segregation ATPase